MDIGVLKNLHRVLMPYDNICPQQCYHCACEEYENAILLPNEEKLISSHEKYMKSFSKHRDGFYYLDVNKNCPFLQKKSHQSKCLIYDTRPFDCRIFPFYPHFDLINVSYKVLKSRINCPLTKNDMNQMENDVTKLLDIVNRLVPGSWKEMYNSLNYQVLNSTMKQESTRALSCTRS